jgi:hypothetical protein
MATSIHLPPDLMERVDKRAKARGVSRNRYIVDTLRRAVDEDVCWSEEFQRTFAGHGCAPELATEVDEMLEAIVKSRKSRQGSAL